MKSQVTYVARYGTGSPQGGPPPIEMDSILTSFFRFISFSRPFLFLFLNRKTNQVETLLKIYCFDFFFFCIGCKRSSQALWNSDDFLRARTTCRFPWTIGLTLPGLWGSGTFLTLLFFSSKHFFFRLGCFWSLQNLEALAFLVATTWQNEIVSLLVLFVAVQTCSS